MNTKYIGSGTQNHDFNYSIKQRGRNTSSNLDANGILAGHAKKTLRGTIDFVHGCKGSVGNKRESVLLASVSAQTSSNLSDIECANAQQTNSEITCKTVPVILCDEEDVSGNHGATIGHVKTETRFYLHARGLSDGDIEKLFLSSFIEDARVAFSNNNCATAQIEAFAKNKD